MSSEQFYQWVSDGVMSRRGTLSLLVGIAIGWTGATLVDDGEGGESSVGEAGESNESTAATSTATATSEPTTTEPTPTDTPEQTTATPTSTTAEPTAEQTATSTPGEGLGANLDVSSRAIGDETSYQVLYSIINRNDVTVVVDFAATVTLRSGETLRQERTATVEPGQAATGEFVFEGYDSSPTGWGFAPTDVRRA